MVIVTGAAGFIGSNLLADLEASGIGPLIAVDWLGEGDKWLNLRRRELAGIIDPSDLPALLARSEGGVRAIFHMGAVSTTTERNVDLLLQHNINYTMRLWDWCTSEGVPFIYASSAATYGNGERGFVDDQSPEALARLKPLNPYGWSKHVVDRMIARRVADGDPTPPQWIGLKFFNVYGPNEFHKGEMRSVVLKLFQTAQAGERLRLFKSDRHDIGDGEQKRDFVYVKDCTRAMLWLFSRPEISGLFNLGTGQSQSFLEVVRGLEHALNRQLPVEFIEMPEELRDRYQYFTEADMTKLRAIGFDPAFDSVEDGIMDYVNHFLRQEDPYR